MGFFDGLLVATPPTDYLVAEDGTTPLVNESALYYLIPE